MKDLNKRKEELINHIKNSSFEVIYQELVEAGLHTYATVDNVINDNEIKLSLISEVETFNDQDISYEEYGEASISSNYSLAS